MDFYDENTPNRCFLYAYQANIKGTESLQTLISPLLMLSINYILGHIQDMVSNGYGFKS
jgi:hypothetical protein